MMHLTQILEEAVQRFGDKILVTCTEGDELVNISFRQFDAHVRGWAAFLREQGICQGDRVGIIAQKCVSQTRAFYACWRLGAIAVPICEGLGDLEMGFIIRDSEPKLILVDAATLAQVRANAADIPVLTFADLPCRQSEAAAVPAAQIAPDAIAALIYTSGSTGLPKGVMLSHGNFCLNARSSLEVVRMAGEDSIMSLLPYWHSFALVVEVILAVMAGARVIIPRDKRDFQRSINAYRPTILLVVPRIVDAFKAGIEKGLRESSPRGRRLFERAVHNASRIFTAGPRMEGGLLRLAMHRLFYDPVVFRRVRKRFGGRLRFLICGGAPLDITPQIFFKYLGIPVYQGYGLTEATPVISYNAENRHKLGSSGQLLSWLRPEHGGDYTFRDETGRSGRTIRGELLVKGGCVMQGYWRHTDESAKTLADGWLHTGDMGYVDRDGFLFLEGRQGNMIVLIGGEKVHPEHVEDAVKASGLVTEAMVIGEGCKKICACVNVDSEQAASMAPAELLARTREEVMAKTAHLAAYQRPGDVLILPDFTVEDGTLTVTLKLRRHKVWQRHGEAIRAFLAARGEGAVASAAGEVPNSRVMETLARG